MALFTILMVFLLLGMSSGVKRNAFNLDDFTDKGCSSTPADIGFILDESGSIWYKHFEMDLEFVKDVIDSFTIGPNNTRISVMTYSDIPRMKFYFREHTTDEAVTGAISSIPQNRGGTRTDLALEAALYDMFQDKMRPKAAHVAIVITDGKSEFPEKTAAAAEVLRSADITVIALGVGTAFSGEEGIEGGGLAELLSIASEPHSENVFRADSFEGLAILKDKLAWAACQAPTTTTSTTTTTTTTTTTRPPQHITNCEGRKPIDVLFGLPPGSSNYQTNLALDFFSGIVDDLEISSTQAQAGLLPRSCSRVRGIRLKDNDNKEGFQADLGRLRIRGSPNHLHLKYLLEEAYSPENAGERGEDVVKTAVLVVDNRSNQPQRVVNYADDLRRQGVTVLVVGVRPGASEEHVRQIAHGDHFYFMADSYEGLETIREFIPRALCRAIMESSTGWLSFP